MVRETVASLVQAEGQEPGGEPTAGVCWPEARQRDDDGKTITVAQVPDQGAECKMRVRVKITIRS